MRYFGGKARVGKKIADFINRNRPEDVPYWEPFVGAGGVLQYIEGEHQYASDICEPLVLMWQALQDGWEPPATVTEEEYKQAQAGEFPPALTAFIGFGCSFGGKWFGGYARGLQPKEYKDRNRNYAANARNSLLKKFKRMNHVEFSCLDFYVDDPPIDEKCFIYCDPPFGGTTRFPGIPEFDSAVFWARCAALHDDGHILVVSEYSAPDEWVGVKPIREKKKKRLGQGSDNPHQYGNESSASQGSIAHLPTVDVEQLYCHRELVGIWQDEA